ncbi:MAG: GWxTD domain-containing protein [bacterium]
MLLLTYLFFLSGPVVELYCFDDDYIELWYQIPINLVLSKAEQETLRLGDSVFVSFEYQFDIYDVSDNDSAYIKGTKGNYITAEQEDKTLVDYISASLYAGDFHYSFSINNSEYDTSFIDTFEILSDTAVLWNSDIVFGRKPDRDDILFHNFPLIPVVHSTFSYQDTLLVYLELYGLVPDSLYYQVEYQVIDSLEDTVFAKSVRRLKYGYSQVDTIDILLADFIEGTYCYRITVQDPASGGSFSATKKFSIEYEYDKMAMMPFYWDIQYLLKTSDYESFSRLSQFEKRGYLKKFWSKNDYWLFERRLLEADDKFSTHTLQGRDSERGKYYIRDGPPDKIEDKPITNWGRPFEVWYYYTRGYRVVFCDKMGNGNPEVVKIFGFGDDIDNEQWLYDIAPGTYRIEDRTQLEQQIEEK